MAEKKFKATIEIGGAVAGSLKSSFAAVTGQTKTLGQSLNKLTNQQKQLRTFNAAQVRIGETQKKLTAAMKNVDLTQMDRLRKSLAKQRESLASLGEELKKQKINTKNLSSEMERLGRKAESTKKVLDGWNKLGDLKIGDKLGSSVRRAALGFTALATAAGAASAAVWKMASGFGNAVDEVSETASNIDIQTNALISYRYAAMQVGASSEMMDKALMEMNLRVADAGTEGNETGNALRELGVDIQALQALDTASRFATISEAFKNYTGSVNKAKLATALMSKVGRKMPNVLNLGREGLNQMAADARAAGIMISEADEKMADAFDTQMNQLTISFAGIRNTIGREILPSVIDLITEFKKTIIANLPQIKSVAQEFGAWLKSNGPVIANQIKDVAVSLVQLARDAAPVIERLGGVKFVLGALTAAAFAPAILGIGSFSLALVQAAPVIASLTKGLWGMAAGGWAAMAPFLPLIGAVSLVVGSLALLGWSIKTYVIDEWDTWKWAIDELWAKLSTFGTSVVEWVGTSSAAFSDFGTNIYNAIVGAFDSVTAKVSAWFDWLKGKLASVGTSISGIFSGGGDTAAPDGARAKGGPVRRGGSYLVGEQGPELFTPGASGSIIPNNRLGGSQNVDSRTYNITINAAPGMDERSLADLVLARLDGRQAALAGGALYD